MTDQIFSPSFGNRPQTLVGREEIVMNFKESLKTKPGSRERAMLILGQRGSGKTVLLLELADQAREQGYVVASPTTTSKGMLGRIMEKLTDAGSQYLKKNKTRLAGGSINVMGFGGGIQIQGDDAGEKSFAFQLSKFCTELKAKSKGALILIDEVQANHEELRQLIIAYQEMVGEGQDIALVLAGLPGAVSATLNDHVLTFLNRATKISLNPLRINDIHHYLKTSFQKMNLTISEEMCRMAAEKTEGSPYLMQLTGHYITTLCPENGMIDDASFHQALQSAQDDFKNDICQTTLNSISETDILFLQAMAQDEGASKIGEIAERLGVSSAYAQLYKRRLIEAGVIEQARRGEVRFCLPLLKQYLLDELSE